MKNLYAEYDELVENGDINPHEVSFEDYCMGSQEVSEVDIDEDEI